ncbi:ABC transporter permease (plasmid) [Roseomonas sp. CCTCC AB2023176]|uniref:ABC transporter permease n=1 Tax=Roseomonas sp. CCTCC AB2023176 TaxID=3342640 RepID=UPI0035D9BF9D
MSATAEDLSSRLNRAADAVQAAERRRQFGYGLAALPGGLLMLGLLIVPMGWLVFVSLSTADGISLSHYRAVVTDSSYLSSLWLTVWMATVVTALCIVLGYVLALAILVMPPAARGLCLMLVALPFWTSVLVRTYGWLVLLQNRGVVNKGLLSLGVIEEPLRMMHNVFGAGVGMFHIMLPFMVFPLVAQMRQIDEAYMRAALGLGAPVGYALRRVFLPLSAPGLAAGAVFVFVLSLGFYITPALLGGGRTMTVAIVIERDVNLNRDWGPAAAVSVLFVLVILLLLALIRRFVPLDRVVGADPAT